MRVTKTQLALAGIGVVAVVAATSVGTMALFTDSKSVGANTFSTGSVSLSTSPTSAVVTFANMMPGDAVTNPVVVTNGGQSMRYAVSSTATNADSKNLMSQLVLTVRTGDSGSPTTCTGGTGTQLYSGVLSAATSSPGTKIVGDNTAGQQSGDRTLAGGANETLCFNVSLPLATTNGYASASTTATFTFDAEQTANN